MYTKPPLPHTYSLASTGHSSAVANTVVAVCSPGTGGGGAGGQGVLWEGGGEGDHEDGDNIYQSFHYDPTLRTLLITVSSFAKSIMIVRITNFLI